MIRIEKATEADIPALNALAHSCYRGQESLKGWTSEADILAGNRTTPQRLLREMSNPEITFLKGVDERGVMVACCLTEREGDRLHCGLLCVTPTLQGAGLGRKMMGAVEQLAKHLQCTKIKIEVISMRKELVEWYQRQGFAPNGKSSKFPEPSLEFGIPKNNLNLELMEMEKSLIQD